MRIGDEPRAASHHYKMAMAVEKYENERKQLKREQPENFDHLQGSACQFIDCNAVHSIEETTQCSAGQDLETAQA